MRKDRRKAMQLFLITSILLIFCVLGIIVFSLSKKVSEQMSDSTVTNLEESLDLISGVFETVLWQEADFQKLLAQELAALDDAERFILGYEQSRVMVKVSLVPAGESRGVSHTGEAFSPEALDFSDGWMVEDLPVSRAYVNDLGTWGYTMRCPVTRDGVEIAALYMEYIFDTFEQSMPNSFYNNTSALYVMDMGSRRFVLKPRGIGERGAGQLDLNDFLQANHITSENIRSEISESIEKKERVLFYHQIQGRDCLIYMWPVNGGSLYLVGYVPVESIQKEGNAVKQNILTVEIITIVAFFLCCGMYFVNHLQQERVWKEREAERELHNRQLSEALQAAQVASTSKTTFLSNMSHDIRTPMNAILGFTTLLAKDAENPVKVREYTRKITASGQHLLSLINDVLDISKIESGKVVLTLEEFNLGDMVTAIDAIIRPAAKAKMQEFDVAVTGIKNERLIGDETRLNQILINLLSNSVKYTPEGGHIQLRMTGLEQRSPQYEHIRIEVEDDGYGMTPEYLKVIFDAFTRAENSTTNKVQGTGLGMAITKNIVELMGGTIHVESQVDQGSLFTVELEFRIPSVAADEQFWKRAGISRILVADDDEDICQTIRASMEDTGILVDRALRGEDALDMAAAALREGNPYHIILLDWNMPGMSGVETARRLRACLPEQVPILLLTACDWNEIEEEAVQAGINAFLPKPFFLSAFKEKILEIQSEQAGAAQVGPEPEETPGLEGLRFLVAEDNEINAEILTELLDIEGAVCEVVENGRLALERFQSAAPGAFDAILMDVQMPVMNGYEATRAIRAMERADAGTIPIIAMTANAFAEDVKDAKSAGMTAHVAKPVNMELLKKTVRTYLKG